MPTVVVPDGSITVMAQMITKLFVKGNLKYMYNSFTFNANALCDGGEFVAGLARVATRVAESDARVANELFGDCDRNIVVR